MSKHEEAPVFPQPQTAEDSPYSEISALNPAACIEAFLEEQRELFEAVPSRWADVKTIQKETFVPNAHRAFNSLYDVMGTAIHQTVQPDGMMKSLKNEQGRQARRIKEQRAGDQLHRMLGTIYIRAASTYYETANCTDDLEVAEQIQTLYSQGKITTFELELPPFLNGTTETRQHFEEASKLLEDTSLELLTARVLGIRAQIGAANSVRNLLSDSTLVMPFIERLATLSRNKTEDPAHLGLLQALAIHLYENEKNNIFSDAIPRALDQNNTLKNAFAEQFVDKTTGSRKKTAAHLAATHLLVDIITQDLGLSRDQLIERVTGRFHEYKDLGERFDDFTRERTAKTQQALYGALTPHLKKARCLPSTQTLAKGARAKKNEIPADVPMAVARSKAEREKGSYARMQKPFDLDDI